MARIVSSCSPAASRVNSARLTSRFSNTASITMSTGGRGVSAPLMKWKVSDWRRTDSAASSLPRLTASSNSFCTLVRARVSASASFSSRVISIPAEFSA